MKTASLGESNASDLLARKLAEYVPLTGEERRIVSELGPDTRHVRRRQDVIVEGVRHRAVFLVIDGIMMRYRILRDGRRQIVGLLIPGDFAGVPGCFFKGALYSIRALTDVTVAVIPIQSLYDLAVIHPRLAAKIFWSFSCEAAIVAEHLVVIGRRLAPERVAHFLLELLTRFQVVGLADECSYKLPLSQEMIGDALGLSLAYVNRVIRQLTDDGLVTFNEQNVTINNIAALSALADFERGYLKPIPVGQFGDADSENSPVEASAVLAQLPPRVRRGEVRLATMRGALAASH